MSNQYVKVTGYSNLVRDKNTGAVVNFDDSARAAYRAKKAREAAERERLRALESEVTGLKRDLADMNSKMDMMISLLMSNKDK